MNTVFPPVTTVQVGVESALVDVGEAELVAAVDGVEEDDKSVAVTVIVTGGSC